MEGSAIEEEEEDNLPEESVPLPRKRVFEVPSKITTRSQRFECYVCEERFDLFEFQKHVKGHTEDLRTTKDQLLSYMEKYSGSTEKMNATIASLIAQGECD
jgi:replication initiation and membrane attachment protein DnaB